MQWLFCLLGLVGLGLSRPVIVKKYTLTGFQSIHDVPHFSIEYGGVETHFGPHGIIQHKGPTNDNMKFLKEINAGDSSVPRHKFLGWVERKKHTIGQYHFTGNNCWDYVKAACGKLGVAVPSSIEDREALRVGADLVFGGFLDDIEFAKNVFKNPKKAMVTFAQRKVDRAKRMIEGVKKGAKKARQGLKKLFKKARQGLKRLFKGGK